MEAKDTVMPDEKLYDVYYWDSYSGFGVMGNKNRLRKVAQAQAEITWDKAIRKVVEAIIEDTRNFEVPLSLGLISKLKEWGIK